LEEDGEVVGGTGDLSSHDWTNWRSDGHRGVGEFGSELAHHVVEFNSKTSEFFVYENRRDNWGDSTFSRANFFGESTVGGLVASSVFRRASKHDLSTSGSSGSSSSG
jgi:hypothetical protein